MAQKNQEIIQKKFDCFNVFSFKDNFSFFHIELENTLKFYEIVFDYFFSDDKLIRYCENTANIKFTPSITHFVILYKHLKTYIDDFNLEKDVSEFDETICSILMEEMNLEDRDGKRIVRLDKIGKIGEYIFCCLLSDFFNFNCIIPKAHLQTDYNMSVYGIDTLFYSEENDLLLFGESKFTLKLDNGINLINKSLCEYEKQLSDEFELVLSSRLYKNKLNKFSDAFGDFAEISIDIKQFIDKAGITQIGIPIFIAHGTETDRAIILNKLSKIKKYTYFGLDTKYISISLPIIDKNKLIGVFTKKIREKEDYYKNEASK
ncbi:Hachiman antiphage defense system protein HamA [Phosphitispora fastidiosa]|uniref:Hachiman antiphage defense system protein HamA n=1 Tax=Phosphitispora fastidiosa TaxID=2837202 RepID=UPI001E3A3CC3|nr:Hachiman antiphage defense system protein HamA [Phosphitispora fastidiosa]MBU7005209.1 hypothetical protein [Phosphitispora fastidiosa]